MTLTNILSTVFCRENIDNFGSTLLFISLPWSISGAVLDNICFTHMTSFPLHFSRLSRTSTRNLLRQFDQVRHSKKRSPRYRYERIGLSEVSPIHWQGMQATIVRFLKPDPVLPPVLAVGDEFEFLPIQRMVGMGYSETSMLSVVMRRI
jgi:hypothetical protein